jgi:hypothetical protein
VDEAGKACRRGERPAELALEVDRLGSEGLREPFQVGAGGTDAVIGWNYRTIL